MKKATNLIITANLPNGAQTTDHYSMMGFTKAYNTAKKLAANEKNSFSLLWWFRHIYNPQMASENYKAEIIAYTADIGQKMNKKNYQECKKTGVKKIIIENLKKHLCKRVYFSND